MRIGLLAGDPSGIGPEVAARLLALPETLERAHVVLIGDRKVFLAGAAVAGVGAEAIAELPLIEARLEAEIPMARVSKEAGAFTLGTLRLGAAAIRQGEIDALVFAPLNKQAMKLAGLQQEDEMHYFADLLGHTGLCSEINVADLLWTTRVTSHVPLRAVADLITEVAVYDAIGLIDRVMRAERGTSPRIAVAGLNPHAGEGGLLGTEEIRVIGPAVERARRDGLTVAGPFPADTLFIAARRGDFDAVVTMYHDQGQIATKLLGFERGVTLQGGLPAPIATPAHGTAFDIAGKGVANAGPIREAFWLACRMAARLSEAARPVVARI
jgi:4-hydroxythreonine-4-phosphate dehydrogenase